MLAASHTEVMSESFLGTLYNDNNIVIWNFECSKVSLQRYFSDTKAKMLLPFAPCDIYLVSSEYLLKYLANLFFCLMHVFWSDRVHSREGLNVTSAGWQVIIINRGVMKFDDYWLVFTVSISLLDKILNVRQN